MSDTPDLHNELEQVEATMESLRRLLSGDQLEAALAPLQAKRQALQLGGVSLEADQATTQGDVTGRDKNIHGDQIARDKVGGDKVGRDKIEASGGSAVAAGQGTAIAGSQNVVASGQAKVIHAETYVERQVSGAAPTPEPDALRTAYLERMLETTAHLSLAGIDPKAASESEARLNLGAVYTALLTLTPEAHERLERGEMPPGGGLPERETRRSSALEQLDRHARLVLLGDPGSGKSTFVNFVALCLAGEALGRPGVNLALLTAPLPDDEGKDGDEPQPWSRGPLLPVRVILRDLAARGLPPAGQRATADHLWRFIAGELEPASLSEYASLLRCELLEKGGLLLLDGLDEVPEADQRREQIRQMVEDFGRTFRRCRIVVTSRTYAYQKQDWRLPGFAESVLAPFSAGQVRRFVDRWYAHIAVLRGLHADDAQGRAELLKRAISSSDRLQALAERPLLLTLMASLHAWRGGSLPEKREELYADTVDLLLDWWERPKVVRDAEGQVTVLQPGLAEMLKVGRDKVRALLDRLAYQAHASQPDLLGTADVPEGELVGGLMDLSQNPDVRPARLVEYLSQRAGLLLPRGNRVYTFPHRTFQEYLAACYLTDHEYPDLVAELARVDPNRWREAAMLAGAKAARGSASAIWLLAEALCYRDAEDGRCGLPDAWGAHLAGQALVETADLAQVSERNQAKVERVRRWQVCILDSHDLPAVERAAAGDVLARLGDPRPGVGLLPLPPGEGRGEGLPDITWCDVPAGPFLMGESKEQHELDLPAFQIARYPVTNAQYAAFVRDGGYTDKWRRCWTAAGWKDKGGRTGPYIVGGVFDLPNHPVVMVKWYEALAFCRWLTEKLKEVGELGAGESIVLPSEAQWEKAASWVPPLTPPPLAGGTEGGRRQIFAWGDEWDVERCNNEESKIGATSAVGCFLGGASPYGVMDMMGNVWEWCSSKWGRSFDKPDFGYPYRPDDGREDLEGDDARILRGGAYYSDASGCRCGFRFGYGPGSRLGSRGFRCARTSL